jgi:protein-L-isoaspartate O-methyltransferase
VSTDGQSLASQRNSDTIGPYDAKAGVLAARYETVRADAVHAALLQFIPHGPDLIALDVGAGSGRDGAWLASLGYDVIAVEPAAGMRAEG